MNNVKKFLIHSFLLIIFIASLNKINPQPEENLEPEDKEIINKLENAKKEIDEAKKIQETSVQKLQVKEKEKNNEVKKVKKEKNKFELNFENAELKNVLDYISDHFNVIFIPDDIVTSDEKKVPGITNVKVTFRSNDLLNEKQVWNLFDLILEMAGFSRMPMPGGPENYYRITNIPNSNKSNLPTYIGTNFKDLPDFERIRYVTFIINRQAIQLKDIISRMQSKNAQLEIFQELNALVFTDTGYNIKSMMQIVKEFDEAGLPEVLSVLKLQNADANEVAKLYENLKGKEDVFRPFQDVKKSGSRITQDTKVIPEPRTNALIIFGPQDSVKRIEDFVKKHLDKELQEPPVKFKVWDLNHTQAEQMASLLNSVTKFGAESESAKFGVRKGEKFLTKMYFEADKQGNRLIARGEPEDFKHIDTVIQQLDVKQPQVAIEALAITISLRKLRQLASQIRSKEEGILNFATSGFMNNPSAGVVTKLVNPSDQLSQSTIVTSLLSLANFATSGTTVLTLGKDSVWAILGILKQTIDTTVVSNPFVIATNKYKARVYVGTTRRIQVGQITGTTVSATPELGDDQDGLSMDITPQINSYGMVNLDISILQQQFTGDINNAQTAGNKARREIRTNADVADGQILVIGGLIRNGQEEDETNVPVLGKIPIIGSLFKNKKQELDRESLFIFITPTILRTNNHERVNPYTKNKAGYAKELLEKVEIETHLRNPVNKWFFKQPLHENVATLETFFPEEKTQNEIANKKSGQDKKGNTK